MPRLLICNTHKTVDVVNDYNTAADMEGKYDEDLKEAINRHLGKYGSDPGKHNSLLMRIEPEEWDLLDKQDLEKAVFDGKLEEYIRGERESYTNDALSCYEIHNRPTYGIGYGIGCPDYRDSSRLIGSKKSGVFLCDFCPYNSYVEHAQTSKVKFKGEK